MRPVTAGVWQWAGLTALLAAVAYTLAPLGSTLAVLLASGASAALTARTLYQEDTLTTARPVPATDMTKLRPAADRLVTLGILTAWAVDDETTPREFSLTTAAGETVVVPRRDMPGMLRGLALGAYAAGGAR